MSAASRRLMVIYNPTAGGARGRRLRRTLDQLRALGCQLDLRETAQRGDAEKFAAEADPAAIDVVVVAGGDGTVNEAINGLAHGRPAANGRPVPLGIIPLGTANVLALEIGLGTNPLRIAQTLAFGTPRRVSLGAVDGRRFLLMAGAGFDAHVVENVRLGLKRHTGKLAYVWEMLVQAVRYGFPSLTATVDGQTYPAATVVVCNGRLYGGPFVAAPDAALEKAGLSVVLLTRSGLMNVLRYTILLGMGKLPKASGVTILQADEVLIDGPAGAPLQADGDVFAHLPVRVTTVPDGLDLVYPD